MDIPFLRSTYNYDRDAASNESGISCSMEERMTKDSFKDECDINTIVRRFNLTGQLPENVAVPSYADFEEIFDFHSAMNLVTQANEAFDSMPAEVRSRFHNDPGEFMDFVSDESNRAEAEKLGLVIPSHLDPSEPGSPVPLGGVDGAQAVGDNPS